ncbi:4Fe-4S dicluster domain-containing protein [Azospirillum halopraeferens]|uniref:4Fe-4S dicluster domain-containing protein n=1 Tax=Azospirillum halopraeferens TaxID=34010 RepID=UPI0004072333|nr:4Fe-4S dicluster domain-containing protein [Azospirillum halopraeferens]
MGMLKTVLANLLRPPRTLAPAERPPEPPALRGVPVHDAGLCTACGTCRHVCAPKAIAFTTVPGRSVSWRLSVGRCSFCGLCALNCPTGAIRLPADMPAAGGVGPERESVVPLIACPRCGTSHVPLPAALADRLWGDRAERDLCPACRRRSAGARLHAALVPEEGAGHE